MISSATPPLQPDLFSNEASRLRPPVAAPAADGQRFADSLKKSAARQSADQQSGQPKVDRPDHADRAPQTAHESPRRAQKELDQGDRTTNAGPDERDPDAIPRKRPTDDGQAVALTSSETTTPSGAVSPGQSDTASKSGGGDGSAATAGPNVAASDAAIAGDSSPVSHNESIKSAPSALSVPSAQSTQGQPQAASTTATEQAPTVATTAAANASASAAVATPSSQESAASTTEKQAKKTDVSPNEGDVAHSGAVTHDDAGGVKVQAVESVQTGVDGAIHSGGAKSFSHALRQTAESPTPQGAPTDAPVQNRLFTAQVSRGLEAALRQNGGSVTMRLKPDTLGPIRIDLHFDQGSIVAKFEATTAQAHDLLSKNLSALHASLESKGFGVRSVEVLVAPAQSSGQASMEFGSSLAGDGRASAHNAGAGANGQSFNRREDPGGQPVDNQSIGRLAEDELPGANWRGVFIDGSLNAIA